MHTLNKIKQSTKTTYLDWKR